MLVNQCTSFMRSGRTSQEITIREIIITLQYHFQRIIKRIKRLEGLKMLSLEEKREFPQARDCRKAQNHAAQKFATAPNQKHLTRHQSSGQVVYSRGHVRSVLDKNFNLASNYLLYSVGPYREFETST